MPFALLGIQLILLQLYYLREFIKSFELFSLHLHAKDVQISLQNLWKSNHVFNCLAIG